MEPIELLRHFARIIKPQADKLMVNENLTGSDAHLKAFGNLLDLFSKADNLKAREREILDALWMVYRRTQKPVERDQIVRELGEKMKYEETTLYRALKRMRDDLGFVRMVGKQWEPLFDPEEQVLPALSKV